MCSACAITAAQAEARFHPSAGDGVGRVFLFVHSRRVPATPHGSLTMVVIVHIVKRAVITAALTAGGAVLLTVLAQRAAAETANGFG